jgi:hypothetical protein
MIPEEILTLNKQIQNNEIDFRKMSDLIQENQNKD